MADQQLIYHGLVSRHSTLSTDLEIMRQTGFEGLEVSAAKMKAALDAGISGEELRSWFRDVRVPGIGFLLDVERHGTDADALMCDAEEMFRLASIAGAEGVQVITGPVELEAVKSLGEGRAWPGYAGVLGLPRDEQMRILSASLARLADAAAAHGLLIYLEALAWLPLNRLADQVEAIARADRGNLRLVVDFWHCHASGDTPEDVARLDPRLIHGVHFCDSRFHGGGVPDESVLRDVATGQGVLNLRDWSDAVKSTGYNGWWSCELFCRRQQQENSFAIARELHDLMRRTIL
ncbi:sugar phosphate isomerase/epimerase [Poseidonocella sp. HB161398]|uniref:sugar phosphate isomerase/epimerase family protein n=1 Tax=Poseidonocella sp. HB161398 TaxID=2320855 RepID=UPI001107B939|nr:sugar phosphate isomerase/epimerase family protein [Poseidonocella sp. HB161398]